MAKTKRGDGVEHTDSNATDHGDTPYVSPDVAQALAGQVVTYDRTLEDFDETVPVPAHLRPVAESDSKDD